jgi:hypothetical protein
MHTLIDQVTVDLSELGLTSAPKDLLSLADTEPLIATFFEDMREDR